MSRHTKGGAVARAGLAAMLAVAVLAPGGLGEAAAQTTPAPDLPTITLSFTALRWTDEENPRWTHMAVTSIRERRPSTVRVVATASAAVAEQVNVPVTVGAAGSTASKGDGRKRKDDYRTTADSATVTIAAGETSGSSGDIRIRPWEDYLVEGDETIRFTAETPAGYQAIPAAELVLDDEDDEIVLRVSPAVVVEGTSETVTVTASFRGMSSLADATDVTVTVSSGDGTGAATLGSSGDFTTDAKGNQITVTIPAGAARASAELTVTAAADTADENFEQGKLTGTASVGGSAVTVYGTGIGIVDARFGVQLTVDADADTPGIQSSLNEDAGRVTVRVTASLASGTAPSGGLTIGVSAWGFGARGRLNETGGRRRVYTGPSSFRAGDDHWVIYPSGQSPPPPPGHYLAIHIPQGKSSGSAELTVAMNDDQVAEDEETLRFVGGNFSAGGNTYRTVTEHIRLIDNDGDDPPPDAESNGEKPSIALSFIDGDEPSPVAITSIEEGHQRAVRVVATASAAVAEQVSLSVTVGTAGSTASKGRRADYFTTTDSATVTIAAGETSGSSGDILISAWGDLLVEGDEMIRFTAEAPTGYPAIPAAELTLADEDDEILLGVSPAAVVEETAETVTVTARFRGMSSALAVATDVTVTAASGDGTGAATLGSSGDFTTDAKGNQITVTIPAGAARGNAAFTVTAAADAADENFELGKLTGSASVGGSAVTVYGTGIGIVDARFGVQLTVDADADTPGIQSSLNEDAGKVTVRVTASLASGTAPSGGLTLGVNAWGFGARGRLNETGGLRRVYTGPSSFEAGDDFWAIYPSGQSPPPPRGHYLAIRIPEGESSGSAEMTVAMNDDQVAEDEEKLRFGGGKVSAGGNTYRIVTEQISLIDNDGNGEKPSIALSLTDGATSTAVTSIEEGVSERVRVVATASAAVAEQVSVSVTVGAAGSTAGKGGRYDYGTRADYYTTANSATVTIAAGETSGSSGDIEIMTWEDDLVEGNETIRFTAEAPAGYPTIPAAELTLDDYDDDIDLRVSPATVVEGTSETITVTASFYGMPSALTSDTDVTVTVASGDGANGATLGSSGDFTTDAKGNQLTVTIPAGRESGSAAFTLTAVADAIDENLEKGNLTGTASVGGSAVAVVDENIEQGELTGSVSVGGSAVTVYGAEIGIVDARFGVKLTVDADADEPGIQSSLNEDAGEVTVRVTASLASGTAPSGGLTLGVSAWGFGATGRLNGLRRVYTGPSSFRAGDDYWVIYPSSQSPPPPPGHYLAIHIPQGKSSGSAELTVAMNDDQVAEGEETLRFVGSDVSAGGNTYKTVAAHISLIDNDGADPPPNIDSGGAPPASGGGNGGGTPPAPGGGSNNDGGAPPAPGGGSGGGTPPPDDGGAPEPPARACVGRFCDEDDSVHQANTERIAQWGITLGCSAADPTLYCPGADITRRQMAAFLYRAVSQRWTIQAPARAELSDVAADAWFRTYADWVISVDAFTAPGGAFNPGGVVTRADMAVMMIAAFPHLEAVDEPEGLFQDARDADPAVVRAIEGLYRAGVTRGCSTDPLNYCPDQPVTRAQMASYFVRAINRAPVA